jgi:hypothetical protein
LHNVSGWKDDVMSRLVKKNMHALALAAALASAGAHAVGWDEAIDGDLSNDPLAPTFVSLATGATTVWGTTGRDAPGGTVDRDYFTVTVPDGYQLDAMLLLPGTQTLGGGSFLAVMAGNVFSVPPETPSAVGLLGWTVFSGDNAGSDMLAAMSLPALGSSGFSVPLPAGNYAFWVQETDVGVATYGFQFALAPVPEAPTVLAMLAGLSLLGAALRRRAAR